MCKDFPPIHSIIAAVYLKKGGIEETHQIYYASWKAETEDHYKSFKTAKKSWDNPCQTGMVKIVNPLRKTFRVMAFQETIYNENLLHIHVARPTSIDA